MNKFLPSFDLPNNSADDSIVPHSTQCIGCQHWDLNYSDEIKLKKDLIKSKLKSSLDIVVKTTDRLAHRTRFDFKFEGGILGLFNEQKQITEVIECQVLHPFLLIAFKELKAYFKDNPPPFTKASMRLRIDPEIKRRGLWIDLANVDVKNLLVEKKWIENIAHYFTIEIGQKRKRLKIVTGSDQHKLTDPQPEIWFQTQKAPLLCFIGGFTQPSWFSADLISETIQDYLSYNHSRHIIEYGAGIGQYTLPLLQSGQEVYVYESDPLAIQCLQENASLYKRHLHLNVHEDLTSKAQTAIVNPPRSGLMDFAKKLSKNNNIKQIIYVSCSIDSLKKDLDVLESLFKLKRITLVDQFQKTKHFETVVFLERIYDAES